MMVHVAIVQRPYDRLLLGGRKDVECRLTRRPVPPFGRITPGERIYFKRSAGPFFATALADGVWMTDNLTPEAIHRLRDRQNHRIHAPPAYWEHRGNARYATLVWLRDLRPTAMRPEYTPQNMKAWYTLDAAADPLNHPENGSLATANAPAFDVPLTAGMLRNNTVRLGQHACRFPASAMGGRTRAEPGESVALHLEAGPVVWTDLVAREKMIRWRGWAEWFQQHRLRPGDRLRFIPDGPPERLSEARAAFYVRPIRSR